MKIYFYLCLCILYVICTSTSCSGKSFKGDGTISFENINGDQMMICTQIEVKNKEIIRLSELVENHEIIRFETSEEALIKSWWTTVTDNYIGVRQESGPFKLFDRKGNFLCNVGAIGQGPGEYAISVKDEIIDEKNGYIYLTPFHGENILLYDLNGQFIKNIPLPYTFHKPNIYLSDDGILTVINMPFKDDKVFAIQIDTDGNIVKEYPVQEYMYSTTFYDNEILSYKNTPAFTYYYTQLDTLFHYDIQTNRPVPVFYLNLPSSRKGFPWFHVYMELPYYYLTQITNFETQKKVLISTHKGKHTSSYVKIVNDYLGGMEVNPFSFMKGYYVYNVEPGELMDHIDKRLAEPDCTAADKKTLNRLLKSLNENSNNLLFIGKLKQ